MMNYINIFFASSGDKSSAKVQRQSGTGRIPNQFLRVNFETKLHSPKSLTSNEKNNTQKYRKDFQEAQRVLLTNNDDKIQNYFLTEVQGNNQNNNEPIIKTLYPSAIYDDFKSIQNILSHLRTALISQFSSQLKYNPSILKFLTPKQNPDAIIDPEKELLKCFVLLFKYLATGTMYKKLGLRIGRRLDFTNIIERIIKDLLIGQLIVSGYGKNILSILSLEHRYNNDIKIKSQFGLLGENFFEERVIKGILNLILEIKNETNKNEEFIKNVKEILEIVSEIEKNVKNKNELDENMQKVLINKQAILENKKYKYLFYYNYENTYEKVQQIKSNITYCINEIKKLFEDTDKKKEILEKLTKKDFSFLIKKILEELKKLQEKGLEDIKEHLFNKLSINYSDENKLKDLSVIARLKEVLPKKDNYQECSIWSLACDCWFSNGLVVERNIYFSNVHHDIGQQHLFLFASPIVLQEKGQTYILNDKNFLDIMEKNWKQMSKIDKKVTKLRKNIKSLKMEEIERNFILGSKETIEALLTRKSEDSTSLIVQKTKTLFEKIKEKTKTFIGSIYSNLFCCKRRKANKEEFEISTNEEEKNAEEEITFIRKTNKKEQEISTNKEQDEQEFEISTNKKELNEEEFEISTNKKELNEEEKNEEEEITFIRKAKE